MFKLSVLFKLFVLCFLVTISSTTNLRRPPHRPTPPFLAAVLLKLSVHHQNLLSLHLKLFIHVQDGTTKKVVLLRLMSGGIIRKRHKPPSLEMSDIWDDVFPNMVVIGKNVVAPCMNMESVPEIQMIVSEAGI
ncbi:hypothetical protein V2J09_009612 [Rumex salicifolius]